jgi:hypothetical protein
MISGAGGSSRREKRHKPKAALARYGSHQTEYQALVALGRRKFTNREKTMQQTGPAMVMPQDAIFAEIGKLHLQVGQQQQNLQNMARAITERDRAIAELNKKIAELESAHMLNKSAGKGPQLVGEQLSPEEVTAMSAALEDPETSEEEKEKIRHALHAQFADDVAQSIQATETKQPA